MNADAPKIDFPDSWLRAMHPRRSSGRRGRQFECADGLIEDLRQKLAVEDVHVRLILDHPASDPGLVSLFRSPENSPRHTAVRCAVWQWTIRDRAPARRLAGLVLREHGLAGAVQTGLELADVAVRSADELDGRGLRQPGRSLQRVSDYEYGDYIFVGQLLCNFWDPIRRWLSVADDDEYDRAVTAAEPYRTGTLMQRVGTSYLFPDRHDWFDADLAEFGGRMPKQLRQLLLVHSGYRGTHLRGVLLEHFSEIATALDALGEDAIPAISHSLVTMSSLIDRRENFVDVLKRIGSDAAFDGLVQALSVTTVPATVAEWAEREPDRAARVLRTRSDDPAVAPMLARHLVRHPELADVDGVIPLADPGTLPVALTTPAWTRRIKAVTAKLDASDDPPSIHWRPGEQAEWRATDPWPTFTENYYDSLEFRRAGSTRFYLGGSDALVRPALSDWEAEQYSFRSESALVLVARFELDAYPPAMRLAQRKPIIGAPLLLPYRGSEVARLMARWLVSSTRFGSTARAWFERHGVDGVRPLIVTALTKKDRTGRDATYALHLVDAEPVRQAAAELGVTAAVDQLLARDFFDLVPVRAPAIPAWLLIEALPPVRVGGRRLGPDQVSHLIQMLALSRPDEPYPGLADVIEVAEPADLAEFAWHLYSAWQYADRPSKDVWAMESLRFLADATVADRLAALVRRWPSDGAAARAKRGAEILGGMPGTAGLNHLGALSRNAKSAPLRAHARQVLDEVASVRGLLPEQLDDLVAPGLDIGEQWHYAGRRYQVELAPELTLRLRGEDGPVTKLPAPTDPEDEALAANWKKLSRSAKAAVTQQVARLEEAMVQQRRWGHLEFAETVIAHPLLGQLARRLIWTVDGRPAAVDALGDLVDPTGGLAPAGNWIALAHPATTDLAPWRDRFAEIRQPFEQLDRPVFDGDPSRWWNSRVTSASLYSLTRFGWTWGKAGRQATRDRLFRQLPVGAILLHLEPGLSAVFDPRQEPDQTIEEISFDSPQHQELAVFADLDRVTRSEILRELDRLDLVLHT